MNSVYTLKQLQAMKRPELHAICERLEISKRVKNADCIEAILAKMPVKVESAPEVLDQPNIKPQAIATIVNDGNYHMPWVLLVDGAEVHRAFTPIQVQRFADWHSLTVVEQPELVEEAEQVIAVSVRSLKEGDRIIHDGAVWTVERIRKFPVRYQENHSIIDGVQSELMLQPAEYKMNAFVWCDRSPSSTDWQKFYEHVDAERKRLSASTKWLKPLAETKFLLAA